MPRARPLFLLLLALCLPACDVLGEEDPPDGPPPQEPTFVTGNANALAPGEPIVIEGAGFDAQPGALYQGRFGDADVEVVGTEDGNLALIVPALPSGEYELQARVGDRNLYAPVRIAPYDAIEAPAEFARAALAETASGLETVLAGDPDPDVQAKVGAALDDVRDAADEFESLGADDQATVAYALRRFSGALAASKGDGAASSAYSSEYCLVEAVQLVYSRIELNKEILVFITAGAALGSTGIGGILGAVFVGVGVGKLIEAVKDYVDQQDTVLEACLAPFERLLEPAASSHAAYGAAYGASSAPASATASPLGPLALKHGGGLAFVHGEGQPLTLTTRYALPGALLAAAQAAYDQLAALTAYLPGSWIAGLSAYLGERADSEVPPGLSLSNVTGGITGEMSASAGSVMLEFEFVGEQPDTPRPFAFTLTDPQYPDFPSTHEATLEPNLLCPAHATYTLFGVDSHPDVPPGDIAVDDDFFVYLNGLLEYEDTLWGAQVHGPVSFQASVGCELQIRAVDRYAGGAYFSPVALRNEATGEERVLDAAGYHQTGTSGGNHWFYDKTFVIDF